MKIIYTHQVFKVYVCKSGPCHSWSVCSCRESFLLAVSHWSNQSEPIRSQPKTCGLLNLSSNLFKFKFKSVFCTSSPILWAVHVGVYVEGIVLATSTVTVIPVARASLTCVKGSSHSVLVRLQGVILRAPLQHNILELESQQLQI